MIHDFSLSDVNYLKQYLGNLWYSIRMINLKNQNLSPCVILVSGGPDSIALAHMAHTANLNIHLVSVNYHMRASAAHDIELVRRFAHRFNCGLHVFDAIDLKGNFQAKARDFRYNKALEVARSVDAKCIMSAHHLDDHLETYLWQIQRKHQPLYYGIKPNTWLQEFKLIRPCLTLSKQDLIAYNLTNNLEYAIDESNESLKYTRNIIRQNVNRLEEKEKKQLLAHIESANETLTRKRDDLSQHITASGINIEWFKTCSIEDQLLCLRCYLNQNKAIKASEEALKQFVHHLEHKDYHQYFAPVYLLVHRGTIRVFTPPQPVDVVIHTREAWEKCALKMKDFDIKDIDLTLFDEDFPLKVRFAKPKDRMQIKIGRKKVFNWFSERKIPLIERKYWIVIENAQKQIVYVKGWGPDLVHKTNKYTQSMVK